MKNSPNNHNKPQELPIAKQIIKSSSSHNNNEDRNRINEEIRADKIRVIRPDGEHLIISPKEALEIAYKLEMDLVEIAPGATPPVCKIMDYGKFVYEKKKHEKEAKKKQHTVQIKELRFRPHTDDHDFEFKMRHAREFLSEGNKVKAMVQFRGRDIVYNEQGLELLKRFADALSDLGKIESPPKLEGKRMNMLLAPTK